MGGCYTSDNVTIITNSRLTPMVVTMTAWPSDTYAASGAQLPDVRLHRDIDRRVVRRPVHGPDSDQLAVSVSRWEHAEALL